MYIYAAEIPLHSTLRILPEGASVPFSYVRHLPVPGTSVNSVTLLHNTRVMCIPLSQYPEPRAYSGLTPGVPDSCISDTYVDDTNGCGLDWLNVRYGQCFCCIYFCTTLSYLVRTYSYLRKFPYRPDLMQYFFRWLYDCLRRLRGIWSHNPLIYQYYYNVFSVISISGLSCVQRLYRFAFASCTLYRLLLLLCTGNVFCFCSGAAGRPGGSSG